MKRLLSATALMTIATGGRPSSAQEATTRYTVVAGDTCESVATKFWGDSKRYDKLHQLNPQMGPSPHKLVPGQVLEVVRPGPLAKVTFVRHDVDAATPSAHKAQLQEPLAQGNKVSTQADSSAEVTFKDDSRLQLSEHTLVVILGGTMHLADKQATAADTQLMTGELRVHLGALAGKKPIATPTATVMLGNGEAKVDVDPAKSTRLAIYKGKATLAASGKKVEVPQGYGSKADLGKAPTKPRPLPDAPTWTTAIPRVVLGFGETVDVNGAYVAGTGIGPKTDTFHVQIAHDLAFNDLVINVKVPATITKLEAKQLPAGTYYARVSGIDNDKFEGAYGAVAAFTVAKVVALGGKSPRIEVPKGLFCGFDGGALAAVDGPLDVPAGKQRKLRCAATADGAGAAELEVDGTPSKVGVTSRFEAPNYAMYGGGGDRDVVLTLTDAAGKPASGASIRAKAPAGVTVEPVTEVTTGNYTARIHWTGKPVGKITFDIDGVQTYDVELPKDAPTPAAVAPISETPNFKRFELGLGLGGGYAGERLGGGGSVALDASANVRVGSTAVFSIGVRGGYERYFKTVDDAHVADAFTFGVPLTLRFGPTSLFSPYLALTPQILFGRSRGQTTLPPIAGVEPPAPQYTSYSDPAVGAGAGLRIGGSRACFFLELGYRFARAHDDGVRFAGALASLGFRVGF